MSRSRTGCWTCRMRKKKCDERHPTCALCEKLRVVCQGYGARPTPSRLTDHAFQPCRVAGIKGLEGAALGSLFQVWRPGKKQPVRQAETDQTESEPYAAKIAGRQGIDASSSAASLAGYVSSAGAAPCFGPHTTLSDSWKIWEGPDSPNLVGDRNRRDLRLLAGYFDKVFSLIAYFYQPPAPSVGNRWLLSLFPRSQPLYYSCLSLGLCYELLVVGGREGSIDLSVELRQLYSLTLSGVQCRIDELAAGKDGISPIEGVDLVASIWQLLSIEVWRTTEGYWELHWDGIGKALSGMVSHSSNHCPSSSQSFTAISPTSNPGSNRIEEALNLPASQWSPESTALKFYIECYAWVDILATATIRARSHQAHSFNYMQLLQDGKLQLANLMGCHDWVMVTINQISSLRDWRTRVLLKHRDRMSLGRIKRRSIQLETRLQNGLASLLEMRMLLVEGLERDRSIVTEIYIHAAMVYLHVVVSGPQIDAPELREHVSVALEELKKMPKRLLIRLSWPFGIIASMASREEEEQFRDVIYEAKRASYWVGTVAKALLLAEECWRLRRVQDPLLGGVDWMVATESLGMKILLI